MSTRRQFLALSSAAAAASGFAGNLFAQFPVDVFSNANLGAYAQGLLTQSTFESQVGSVFKAFLPDRRVSYLTLLAVRDMTPQSASTTRPGTPLSHVPTIQRGSQTVADSLSFDLAFSVSGPAIEQQSYTLDHGVLGRFVVFLVPGLSPAGANTCGASFNYLAIPAAIPGTPRSPVSLPVSGSPIAASPLAGSPMGALPVTASPIVVSPGAASPVATPGAGAGVQGAVDTTPVANRLQSIMLP